MGLPSSKHCPMLDLVRWILFFLQARSNNHDWFPCAISMSSLFTWHGYVMLFCGSFYVFFYGSSRFMAAAPVITGVAIAFSCMGLVPFFALLVLMLGALVLLYVFYIVFICLVWPLEKCSLSRRRAVSRRNGGYRSNGITNTTDLRRIEQAIVDAENGVNRARGSFAKTDNIKETPAMAAIPIVIFRKPKAPQNPLTSDGDSSPRSTIAGKVEIIRGESDNEGSGASPTLSGNAGQRETSDTLSQAAAAATPSTAEASRHSEASTNRSSKRKSTGMNVGSGPHQGYSDLQDYIIEIPDSIPCDKPSSQSRSSKVASTSGKSAYDLPADYPTILDEECAICLFDFEDGDELRHLYCDHFFHRSCVDRWLTKHAFCPKCKRYI